MILDVKDPDIVAEYCPCVIVDANGMRWETVTFCDTETGEIEFLVKQGGVYVLSEDGTSVMRSKVKTAAPLRIELIKA